MTTKQKKWLSDLALLFVAFAWGGGFLAVKDALNAVPPMYLMAYRFVLAALVVYVSLFKWIGKISREEFFKGSLIGGILFIAFALQTLGLQYTTVSKQGFLTAVYVVFVPLIYWALYRKMPKIKVFLGSFLAIMGIGLIALEGIVKEGSFMLNKGDLLTLACAFFFALHIIAIEYFAKEMHVFKIAFMQIAVAAVLFVGAALVFETAPTNLDFRSIAAIVYLAVVSTFACFTVQTVAQKYTASSHVSIIMSLESVFAALLGVMVLGESFTKWMVLGCGLIFAAILTIELDFKQ